ESPQIRLPLRSSDPQLTYRRLQVESWTDRWTRGHRAPAEELSLQSMNISAAWRSSLKGSQRSPRRAEAAGRPGAGAGGLRAPHLTVTSPHHVPIDTPDHPPDNRTLYLPLQKPEAAPSWR
ncbi:hypothetical protein GDO81_029251, partial [Engystomops pustulosus]